jgi:ketosteroid isomerase-like protein
VAAFVVEDGRPGAQRGLTAPSRARHEIGRGAARRSLASSRQPFSVRESRRRENQHMDIPVVTWSRQAYSQREGWGCAERGAEAASGEEAEVAQVVEGLRKATLGQDKAQLDALCTEQLSYGHSDGRVETKVQFIDGVMGRKSVVKSLTLSDHAIAVVGSNAIARHSWTSESEMDGKATTTKIKVLQVWLKQSGGWKLLARQAVRPPQPA